jgi:hypothetical protein
MKPQSSPLAIVTATLDPVKAAGCFMSWMRTSLMHLPVYVVWGTLPQADQHSAKVDRLLEREHRAAAKVIRDTFEPGVVIAHEGGGVVPAFAKGVARAFQDGAQAVVCLHDDVLIEQDHWDEDVALVLSKGVKFAGFGGAVSLGSADLYQRPYDPMQLARGGFVSNMRDAEAHGRHYHRPVPCVCFDGFCQIGTKDWFGTAWAALVDMGIRHHFYDGMLGCLAARAGVQPGLMIPVACHHFGGRTAVGNAVYQEWAKLQLEDGDHGFWLEAHRKGYEEFRDVLPLYVNQFPLTGVLR